MQTTVSPCAGHRKEKFDLAFHKLHDRSEERAGVAMALSTRIHEVFRQNFRQATGYPKIFRGIPQYY
jgi:hypothetical protein